jgi:hypothetical protein
MFLDQGSQAVKNFIDEKILSRHVSAENHYDAYVKLNKPRQLLVFLTKKLGKPNPIARFEA